MPLSDDESWNGHPVKDDGGPFMHACYCGKWGVLRLPRDADEGPDWNLVLRRAPSGGRGGDQSRWSRGDLEMPPAAA